MIIGKITPPATWASVGITQATLLAFWQANLDGFVAAAAGIPVSIAIEEPLSAGPNNAILPQLTAYAKSKYGKLVWLQQNGLQAKPGTTIPDPAKCTPTSSSYFCYLYAASKYAESGWQMFGSGAANGDLELAFQIGRAADALYFQVYNPDLLDPTKPPRSTGWRPRWDSDGRDHLRRAVREAVPARATPLRERGARPQAERVDPPPAQRQHRLRPPLRCVLEPRPQRRDRRPQRHGAGMTWGVNDYPWRNGTPNANNPANCNYAAIRNCDDFTMWRWRHDLGQPCGEFGSALSWPSKAAAAGYVVSAAPAIHTILCIPPGEQDSDRKYGHVAAVLEVGPSAHAGPGEVWCESYNWTPYAYSQNVFRVEGGVRFLHAVKVGPPPPPPPPPPSSEDDPMQFTLLPQGDPNHGDFVEIPGVRDGQSVHVAAQDRSGAVGKVAIVFAIPGGKPEVGVTVAIAGTVPGVHGPITGDVPVSGLGSGFGSATVENLSPFTVIATVTTP